MASGAQPFTATAQAQAVQPVVDVCTGISLDPSAVTTIVGDVAVPTATAVEDLFDALLNVSILGAPILTLQDVEIGAADTLQSYADGDPISLRVADTSGTLLAPDSDCNLAADNYTLNDDAGIAIGGNQITGLGDGQIASAGELDAIAFGNNASTAVGANGAIAIGTNASATAANSVALGSDSLADRGALTGYSAPGLAGTYNSVGSVSVGTAGSLRQITNVAPGTQATDAATVGQVQGALDAIQTVLGNGVQYDGPAQASVTLAGSQGTTIINLADGAVTANSTDAVNGGQLFATNQQVTINGDDIDDLDSRATVNEGDIDDIDGRVTVVEGDIVDLDDRISINADAFFDLNDTVVAIDTRVTQNTTDIASLQLSLGNVPIGYVSNSDPAVASAVPTNRVALIGGTMGAVVLGNVGPGALAAGSTDAVNGSQLFATNQQVNANMAAIQANADAMESLEESSGGNALAVLYDDLTRSVLTLEGADGTIVGNVADGEVSETSGQAVNGSQLFATNQAVAANSDAIDGLDARVAVNEGDIADLDNRVTVNEGNIADLDNRLTVNEGDIANLDTRVTINEGDIGDLNDTVTEIDARVTDNSTQLTLVQGQLANVPLGYVSDSDPTAASTAPTNTAALIGASADPVTLANVAEGTIAAGSTDAVNGSQLAATNDQVASNRTDIDANTANIAALNNNLQGNTVAAVQYSDPDNPNTSNGGTITNDVTLVGADATAPVTLHNVAAGTRTNDAVNLGQMQDSLAVAMADTRAYTDLRFDELQAGIAQLDFDLEEVREDASAGTASAMAVSGIPQTISAGRSMIGTGVAHYRGETALAIGMSTTFNDGYGVVKAGATMDTRGNGGVSAGAGISF
ncbi:YadA family autotransporter adhesin [Erythrobacter sp.]|uniref:YadA family autotransporter adhesin n=1 Tax=Erythrobacter sp. TaxID=1042 RepID=UPI003C75D3AE